MFGNFSCFLNLQFKRKYFRKTIGVSNRMVDPDKAFAWQFILVLHTFIRSRLGFWHFIFREFFISLDFFSIENIFNANILWCGMMHA